MHTQGTGHIQDVIKKRTWILYFRVNTNHICFDGEIIFLSEGLPIIGTGGGAHICWTQRLWFYHTKGGDVLGQMAFPKRSMQASIWIAHPCHPYILPPPSSLSGLQI
jgi:hypothetical protein